MEVPMELSRIVINANSGGQLICLREVGGAGRTFPIEIGTVEAYAIDRRLKGLHFPRPLTHELLANVIEALGGKLEKVVINELQHDKESGSGTFIATIHILQNGKTLEIDSRPSDAIALGAAFNTPVFVEEEVLQEVLREPATRQERIEMLRQRSEFLAEQIERLSSQLEDKEFLDQASHEAVEHLRQQLAMMRTEYEAIDQLLKKYS